MRLLKSTVPVLLVLVLVLVLGCATRVPPPESRDAAEASVYEAVFRHLFRHNASAARSRVDYYFLAIGDGEDPPPALLARFAGHVPKVEPVSASRSSPQGVRHEEDGGKGLVFRIEALRWLDADTAEVEGGYFEASLSASGNTHRVERRRGRWVVVDDRRNWIS